jgi:atlastin
MSAVQICKLIDSKYVIDFSAIIKIFSKAKNHGIAIYSLSGTHRSGKSFMLQFFLKYLKSKGQKDWIKQELQSSFPYRGGSKRVTIGLWMWSEPFILKREDGTEVYIFLIDNEGLFNNQTTMQENVYLFALSSFLSSVQILNIKENVSEDKIQFIRYFLEFCRINNNGNEGESLQELLFLVRDWQNSDYDYGFYDNYTSKNGKNFKIDFLDPNESHTQCKSVREKILSSYDNVSCYLMPHPGFDVSKMNKLGIRNLDPDFLNAILEFVPLMFDEKRLVLKKFNGLHVTGREMIIHLEKWKKLLKKDAILELKYLFQSNYEHQILNSETSINQNHVKILSDNSANYHR